MPDEKMKYPLLEFEYDKKLYEELLTLNPHPEFMDRVSIVTEDYEHDDFGSLPGDEKMLSATQQVFYGRFKNTGCPFRMKKAKPSERENAHIQKARPVVIRKRFGK